MGQVFFLIVLMPYLSWNTPFYGSTVLGIAWSTLKLTDFVPKASQLYTRMIKQGGNKASILHVSIYLSVYLSIYLSIYLSVCLSVCLSILDLGNYSNNHFMMES